MSARVGKREREDKKLTNRSQKNRTRTAVAMENTHVNFMRPQVGVADDGSMLSLYFCGGTSVTFCPKKGYFLIAKPPKVNGKIGFVTCATKRYRRDLDIGLLWLFAQRSGGRARVKKNAKNVVMIQKMDCY